MLGLAAIESAARSTRLRETLAIDRMRPRLRSFLLTLGALLVTAAVARADVVGMTFVDCPHGATSMTRSHGGATYCTPVTCANDSECGTGPCRRAGLCVSETDFEESISPHAGGGSHMVHQVVALRECSSNADCEGVPCVFADRCVDQGPLPDAMRSGPSAGGACGCRVGSSEPPHLLACLALALWWRRRSRRAS